MTATYKGPTNENYEHGKSYSLQTRSMTGKIYKDLNDRIGEPDNRIMLWNNGGTPALKVYDTELDISKDWKIKAQY